MTSHLWLYRVCSFDFFNIHTFTTLFSNGEVFHKYYVVSLYWLAHLFVHIFFVPKAITQLVYLLFMTFVPQHVSIAGCVVHSSFSVRRPLHTVDSRSLLTRGRKRDRVLPDPWLHKTFKVSGRYCDITFWHIVPRSLIKRILIQYWSLLNWRNLRFGCGFFAVPVNWNWVVISI